MIKCCWVFDFSWSVGCFRTYGRASRQLRIATDCVPFNPDVIPRFDEWALIARPFLHTYWTCCVRKIPTVKQITSCFCHCVPTFEKKFSIDFYLHCFYCYTGTKAKILLIFACPGRTLSYLAVVFSFWTWKIFLVIYPATQVNLAWPSIPGQAHYVHCSSCLAMLSFLHSLRPGKFNFHLSYNRTGSFPVIVH